jgi:hypothetical protein
MMTETRGTKLGHSNSPSSGREEANLPTGESIKIIQHAANLRCIEQALKQHWNLGQHILLCWCMDKDGIRVLPAPHYFLGQFSMSLNDCQPADRLQALNGSYVRKLISGSRMMTLEDFNGAASRLQLEPVTIKLPAPITDEALLSTEIETLIQRYSINFVKNRAVMLFDIVDFSLVSPFEQTSQLNSLSYSLNAAHNKLLQQNIDISFSRTTTGDGYYVWHNQTSPRANLELFEFMILVIANNAFAQRSVDREKKYGHIVPKIRTGFHIGSHFEFYQVEGLNPGMNSYIVGDVTIELARMVDQAGDGQIFIGDFETQVPTSLSEGAYLIAADTQRFVERAVKLLSGLKGITLSKQEVTSIHCFLSGETGASGGENVRRFLITDKHGRSRKVYNLKIFIKQTNGAKPLMLGKHDSYLPARYGRRKSDKLAAGRQFPKRERNRSSASIRSFDDKNLR